MNDSKQEDLIKLFREISNLAAAGESATETDKPNLIYAYAKEIKKLAEIIYRDAKDTSN